MQIDLIAAITLDGFIGRTDSQKSTDWTSPEDTRFYVDQIKDAGVVVMGRKTFETFERYPKGLTFVIYTSDPDKFENPNPDRITAYGTDLPPKELIEKLEKEGHKRIMISGGASIYTQFMQAGVVNRLFLSVEPVIFGSGVKLFNQEIDSLLELSKVHKISEKTRVFELKIQ